jgi:hypothetical protein
MQSKAATIDEYFESLPEGSKEPMNKLRKFILKNLPKGYKEGFGYGMPCYSVPLSTYPAGYHVSPGTPLALMSLASQKNFIALYHMGLYANSKLLKWFTDEYPKHCKKKLDMGKACIRFKYMDDIPYALIGELAAKMTPQDWIACYEKGLEMAGIQRKA